MTNKHPQVHGHRGARGRMPENTLVAVEFAVNSGADGVEVDLCVTRDDVVVVHHDPMVSSTFATHKTQGRQFDPIPIRALTLDELLEYDFGILDPDSSTARRFPEQYAIAGQRVLTLSKLLEWMQLNAREEIIVNLELKSEPGTNRYPAPEGYIDLVIEQIEARQMAARVFLQSFDWRLVRIARDRCPVLDTGVLTDQQWDGNPRIPIAGQSGAWTDEMDLADYGHSVPRMVAATGAPVWSSNFMDVDIQSIAEAHQLGLRVSVWTVNQTEDMQRMIDWGVDAITTDYPDRLVELLG